MIAPYVPVVSVVTPEMPTRHFNTVNDLVTEIASARVWGGLHYRGSALAGIKLGTQVADWTLQRYFLPAGSK